MKRRYVYREVAPGQVESFEVTADYTGAETRAQTATEGLVHGANVAPDGTDISTKRKRREWMKATGSADRADYVEHLAKARAERDSFYREGPNDPTRGQDIYRAMQQARRRGK